MLSGVPIFYLSGCKNMMRMRGLCRRQVFLDFAKALLNDLSYLMEESFDRIADVQARLSS